MSRIYHYVGEAVGIVPPGAIQIEGLPGIGDGGRVRTRLWACDDCGAVVPEGKGGLQHDGWHDSLESTIGRPVPIWYQR